VDVVATSGAAEVLRWSLIAPEGPFPLSGDATSQSLSLTTGGITLGACSSGRLEARTERQVVANAGLRLLFSVRRPDEARLGALSLPLGRCRQLD
jgi:hypothetical protein